jgi:hypothetical protein
MAGVREIRIGQKAKFSGQPTALDHQHFRFLHLYYLLAYFLSRRGRECISLTYISPNARTNSVVMAQLGRWLYGCASSGE